jgi:hypothetical protein
MLMCAVRHDQIFVMSARRQLEAPSRSISKSGEYLLGAYVANRSRRGTCSARAASTAVALMMGFVGHRIDRTAFRQSGAASRPAPPYAAKRRFAGAVCATDKKFLSPRTLAGQEFILQLQARQYAASIVSRYGGKCWSLSLQLTIFTAQFNKEMGSQRRRR